MKDELSKYTLDPLNFSTGQAWVNALDQRILMCVKTAALEVFGKTPQGSPEPVCAHLSCVQLGKIESVHLLRGITRLTLSFVFSDTLSIRKHVLNSIGKYENRNMLCLLVLLKT